MIFTKVNIIQQVYGASGRNTGALTYLFLIGMSITALLITDKFFLYRILKSLLIAGTINTLYGCLQILGIDPYDWTSRYSPGFGFFGNPNFHSSFSGLIGIVSIAKLFEKNTNKISQIRFASLLLLAVVNIWKSNSIQGFLVLGVGISVLYGAFVIFAKISNTAKISYLFIPFVVGLAAVLDIFQKVPWKPILYQESISSRGDFWHAGWEMTKSNPFFGIGFDNYGDRYRQFRTSISVSKRGAEVVSNSAHNAFLDISANGGFILLGIYTATLLLALRAMVRYAKVMRKFDSTYFTIVALWFGFLAQSLISVGQIGLNIWGWILTAVLIGYNLNSKTVPENLEFSRIKKSPSKWNSLLVTGFIAGLLIAYFPFKADMNYRSAGQQLTPQSLMKVAYTWPKDSQRMLSAALTFRDNSMPVESLKVAKDVVQINKYNYIAWKLISMNELSTPTEREMALKQLKILDPYNPNNS